LPLAQRAHQLLLVHAAAPLDPALLCDVVELVLRPRFVAAVRVAGPLRRAVRGPSLLPPPFVDGAGGNLLRPVLAHPPPARALLDVLVLALVLVAPRSGHVVLRCWCGMRPPPPIPPALPRSTSAACEPRAAAHTRHFACVLPASRRRRDRGGLPTLARGRFRYGQHLDGSDRVRTGEHPRPRGDRGPLPRHWLQAARPQ